jgi:hypothetical protein
LIKISRIFSVLTSDKSQEHYPSILFVETV